MDMEDLKALRKKLKRKRKRTLRAERQDLQERQDVLRNRKEVLEDRRDKLIEDLILARKAEDSTTETVIMTELELVKEKIEAVSHDYKANGDILKVYSSILKDDADRKDSHTGLWLAGLGIAGSLGLGYLNDIKGTLSNKKALDVFKTLNPGRKLLK